MNSLVQAQRSPAAARAEVLRGRTLQPRSSRHIAVFAAIVFGVLLIGPLASLSGRAAPRPSAAEARVFCSDRDAAVVEAVERRLGAMSAVGKQVYARTAKMWLLEARRTCGSGSADRAELFYGRIISSADRPS